MKTDLMAPRQRSTYGRASKNFMSPQEHRDKDKGGEESGSVEIHDARDAWDRSDDFSTYKHSRMKADDEEAGASLGDETLARVDLPLKKKKELNKEQIDAMNMELYFEEGYEKEQERKNCQLSYCN